MEDEEAERLARVVDALERKDDVQQRMAAITKLTVAAWRCAVCATTSERRRAACQARAWHPRPPLTAARTSTGFHLAFHSRAGHAHRRMVWRLLQFR